MRRMKILPILLCILCCASTALGESTLTLTLFDSAEGAAALLQCDGEAMLINTGPRHASGHLIQHLLALGIPSFSYILVTDPASHNVGGLGQILKLYDTGTLWMQTLPDEMASSCYQHALFIARERGFLPLLPELETDYRLGNATFTLCQHGSTPEDSQYSLLVNHGNVHIIIAANDDALASAATLPADERSMAFSLYPFDSTLYAPDLVGPVSFVSDCNTMALQGIRHRDAVP